MPKQQLQADHESAVVDYHSPSTLQEVISSRSCVAETRITHIVFPGTTNHHGTLFGGEALSMMDSAAFIAATRYCRRKVVTRHLDAMEFSRPIPQGTLVELVARVVKTGLSSMTVLVELFIEDMYSDRRLLGCSGTFVLVALGDDGQPTAVSPLPEGQNGR